MATVATAREYFDQVVAYNVQQYKAQPTSLPAAFNVAVSLFSMHEWMWDTYGNKLETELGKKFDNKKAFNNYVQDTCPVFKHIRDLANASKHVSLSSPSTQATHITDTSTIECKWGEAIWGISKWGRGVVVINDGETKVEFENTADIVIAYWGKLLARIGD